MRIDAHQHFWLPARIDYAWMKGLDGEAARRLRRPILPAALEPILARHAVTQTVLVQAATDPAEAEFLLSLAEAHAFIAGAVVWLDMADPRFEQELDRRSAHPRFLGVRPMLQDVEDLGWLRLPEVRRSFAVLEERGVCFDFLIKSAQLPAALEVMEAHPRLRAVIDHIAKPDIAHGRLAPWDELLKRVAQYDGVYCKLSGMITEADHERWSPADLAPFIAHALRCFGPDRCMFGSDWPVCTLAGGYAEVLGALEENLALFCLGPREMDGIFAGNARQFYRLPLAPATRPAS